jgi:hypothetical protein
MQRFLNPDRFRDGGVMTLMLMAELIAGLTFRCSRAVGESCAFIPTLHLPTA